MATSRGRVYLTGGNPFAMSYNKLMDIAILLRKYLPEMVSFGMFARVTDIASKSVEELKNLRHMKITGILPKDKAMIIRELDKAIAEFPEQELRAYRNRVWHL